MCELGGIRVSETLMPRGLELPEHAHAPGQICFVLEGSYRERLESGARVLRAGMMHVRAPRAVHANEFGVDEDVLALLISIDASRWIDASLQQPVRILDDVASAIRDEMRRGDEAARAALEGFSMLALSRVARMAVPATEPEWLGDAFAMIERRYAEALSLTRIAVAIGVSRGTLAAAFRRFHAASVGETIRAVRVRRARELLRDNVPLAEIAVHCGFHDQAHFTRVFREMTGVTPGRAKRDLGL